MFYVLVLVSSNPIEAFTTTLFPTSLSSRSIRGGGATATVHNVLSKASTNGAVKNGNADALMDASFVAETTLPTDLGTFRLRAYRTAPSSNPHAGNEPCVIYSADKPPFGADGELREGLAIRVHDQCMTGEVFGSQR